MEQIEQFEASAHIVLPQDYKDFLLHIGNGGKHSKQFPLSLSHAKDSLEESLRKTVGLEYMSHRSFHEVIGRVNRLFTHDIGGNRFPLYVEGLEQEILIKGVTDIAVSVGDVIKIRGRLSGEVYRITR